MKKYQIFVSSTYLDLIDERAQVTKAILKLGHIPVGMEMFNASDESQWKLIQRQIDDCDYYVIILAHRYGSRDTDGRSYTEKEYDYAVSKGIPVLGFVIDSNLEWLPKFIDKGDDLISLNVFKEKVKTKMVEFWPSKEILHALVISAISVYINGNPRVGWVRASENADPGVLNEVARLSSENSELRKELEDLNDKIHKKNEGKIDGIISMLSKNKIDICLKYEGSTQFGKGPVVSYDRIFRVLVPELLHAQNFQECMSSLAYGVASIKGENPASEFPIGTNIMRGIVANLIALELIDTYMKGNVVLYNITPIGLDTYKRMILNKFEQ